MMAYSVNHAEPEGVAEINEHGVGRYKIYGFGKGVCFNPAEQRTEKQNWCDGVDKALRAELLKGIGQAN